MQTEKLSLSNIKNVLSRAEMKKIMAGRGCSVPISSCSSDSDCGGNRPKCCTVNSSVKGCATTC